MTVQDDLAETIDVSSASPLGVSVVIASYGRPDGLQRLIDGLADQSISPDEVIVVDDGHDVPAAPHFPMSSDTEWVLIRQPNGGAGAARHTGIERATGDVIVILDDDMIVGPDLIGAHRAAHERGVDVVQGHFDVPHHADRPLFDHVVGGQQRAYFEQCAADPAAFDPVRLATGNVSFRRELYLRAGGFDRTLRRREDAELGLRFAALGARFEYRREAAAIHDEAAEPLDRWLRVAEEYGSADAELAARHPAHSPWALFAQMPLPARSLIAALRYSPKRMRRSGRALASFAGVLERAHVESIAVRSYGLAFALHWFAGLFSAVGPEETRRHLRDQQTTTAAAAVPLGGDIRVRFGEVDVDVIDRENAVQRIVDLARSEGAHLVVTPNVDHLVRARRDPTFNAAYRRAALVLADGQPLIMVARALRLPLRHKLSGSDLLDPVMAASADNGLRVYFLGATEATSAEAARRLTERYPGLQIVGRSSPWFNLDDDMSSLDDTLAEIASSAADVVVVALGTPKQEVTLERLFDQLPPAVYCGFGAGLDFTAGVVSRAPAFVSKIGFEWLWRLALEPRRLWKRYIVDDVTALPIFVSMAVDRLRGRPLVVPAPGQAAP